MKKSHRSFGDLAALQKATSLVSLEWENLFVTVVGASKTFDGLLKSAKSLNPKSYILNSRKGQSIIELVIALSITVVGLLAMLSLYSSSYALNRVIAWEYTGTYLAAEGIEIAKNILDANPFLGNQWETGFDVSGDYEADYASVNLGPSGACATPLLFDGATGLYGYVAGNPSPFTRCIAVRVSVPPDPSQFIDTDFDGILDMQVAVRVVSRVTWTTRGGGTRSIELEDHFFRR